MDRFPLLGTQELFPENYFKQGFYHYFTVTADLRIPTHEKEDKNRKETHRITSRDEVLEVHPRGGTVLYQTHFGSDVMAAEQSTTPTQEQDAAVPAPGSAATFAAASANAADAAQAASRSPDPAVIDLAMQNEQTIAQINHINEDISASQVRTLQRKPVQ